MPKETQPNEVKEIVNGFVLVMLLHALAGVIIFSLGFMIGSIFGNYTFLTVWIVVARGFLFWQLLYVIPLALRFQHRNKIGMMKGVIIGAVFTALVNGTCFLSTAR